MYKIVLIDLLSIVLAIMINFMCADFIVIIVLLLTWCFGGVFLAVVYYLLPIIINIPVILIQRFIIYREYKKDIISKNCFIINEILFILIIVVMSAILFKYKFLI